MRSRRIYTPTRIPRTNNRRNISCRKTPPGQPERQHTGQAHAYRTTSLQGYNITRKQDIPYPPLGRRRENFWNIKEIQT
uniref:Uncharacterized protein n=1 Tax=Physcomitrium patens TaxID=3218 RepID=A0A7I4EF68_PHYPA